jgi:hypothetical protein
MRRHLLIILLIALIARAVLLASNTVSFHSDEAVVALMARHILQGERPVFFYGQAYMGSLDAWLVAIGFQLFGESVLTIRIVQAFLYLLIVATGYLFAWRVSGKSIIAAVTGLILALPPVLFALYTTATLGGYNEMLLCGNLVLLFGYEVAGAHRRSWWRWAALGLAAGIGWWANGLIIAFALPVGLFILWQFVRHLTPPRIQGGEQAVAPSLPSPRWRGRGAGGAGLMLLLGILIAAAFFVIGSAAWWGFNFANDFAPLRFYLVGGERGEFAGTDIPPLPFPERILGLIFLGLPAVFGLRFPWSPVYVLPVLGVGVLLVYLLALVRLARAPQSLRSEPHAPTPLIASVGAGLVPPTVEASLAPTQKSEIPDARPLVLGMIGLFCVLFVASRFSIDPTGRYFLPVILPLAVVLGTLIDGLWGRRRVVAVALITVVLGYNLIGQVTAASNNPPGFTTQFNLDTHIPNTWDAELIAFLDEHELYHGYTNYWVSFRLAFLSGDRMQYSAALSYKPDLSYTPADDRYLPYVQATAAADRIAYITANVAEVKAWLEAQFAARGVTYQSAQVGVYHIYYDFTPEAPRPPFD